MSNCSECGGSYIYTHTYAHTNTHTEVMRQENIKKVQLLKVDVEGDELDVLMGLHDCDWPKIQQVYTHTHTHTPTDTHIHLLFLSLSHIYVYTHTHTYFYTHKHINMCDKVDSLMGLHDYDWPEIQHVCTRKHTHTHTHAHTHKYKHTYVFESVHVCGNLDISMGLHDCAFKIQQVEEFGSIRKNPEESRRIQ